jgi:hypothetical protein
MSRAHSADWGLTPGPLQRVASRFAELTGNLHRCDSLRKIKHVAHDGGVSVRFVLALAFLLCTDQRNHHKQNE